MIHEETGDNLGTRSHESEVPEQLAINKLE